MNNLLKEELSFKEWNDELKKALKKLNKPKCSRLALALGIVTVLAIFSALIFVLIKHKRDKMEGCDCGCGCEDDEEDSDENGCRYTDDDDFEESK